MALQPGVGEVLSFEIAVRPLAVPETIVRLDGLEAFIRAQQEFTVGGVIGTASYVKTTNMMSRGLREAENRIPENHDRIDWIWRQFERIRGSERLRQVVDASYSRALVTVFLENANFIDVKALMAAIRAYEAEHLAPQDIALGFAGDVAVSQSVIEAIVTTQRWSLIGSLVGILLITAVLGRSLGWGLLSVLPCGIAVLVNFAVMGMIGMPLGVATSMFAGMTLGIGVDYAIHLLERYRHVRRQGLERHAAAADAVAVTGPAILVDAVAVAAGFGIMTLSQVPANSRLGALLVLSILGCFLVTMLLLPAVLSAGDAGARRGPPEVLEAGDAGAQCR